MPRAFVAIAPTMAMRSTCAAARDAFLSADPSWCGEKWVSPENLHVTLRFLGILPEPAIRVVTERLRVASATIEPFRLRLDTPRAVPRSRSASLLWLNASCGAPETEALADAVGRATSFLDFRPDNRRFVTHMTLCRARRPRRAGTDALVEMERITRGACDREASMSVRQVTLYASTLTPRGPVYEELAVIPLGCD